MRLWIVPWRSWLRSPQQEFSIRGLPTLEETRRCFSKARSRRQGAGVGDGLVSPHHVPLLTATAAGSTLPLAAFGPLAAFFALALS